MQGAPFARTGPGARRRAVRASRTVPAVALLAAVLALSGCGASGDDAAGGADRGYSAAQQEKADSGAAKGGGAGAPAAAEAQRKEPGKTPKPAAVHVIRTASLSVEVKDAAKAAARARTAAQDAGGLVEKETTERIDGTRDSSHLVLRVPQDAYDEVLRELSGTGKLVSRTSAAKDVTDQVVDIDSRIATQRASVARVRELMDRADKLADVVTLEGELSSRQAALESLLAQQASLKDRTTLATITLDLVEPEPGAATAADDDPGFSDAVAGGWHAFVTVLRWLAMAMGAAAPFLAAAAVLAVLWRLLLRRRAERRRGPAGEG
ncbi:DUF4349 domain-containing protein [Streptomyces sp. NBC_00525]|uniref:DUF4349 domain-containing protein n=1 Tax=Streptomyces sp. NBC_00525 TaxID=2903660 RepID=UPI002E7FBBB0|nr:DUF4349 domain-containing protein [Streptomyces sp. NBC_00525]WUC96585.1 DUF4349 domain-containing protein [Streptomyces sp. NBC_00525]